LSYKCARTGSVAKSGDAIAQIGPNWNLHVVDGGYASTAPDLSRHIRKYYGTTHINRVVVTHPDQDHAEGLALILEEFSVDELWMLRPWVYADLLVQHFARYTSAQVLQKRLQKDYPCIEALEKLHCERAS
jgi:beta-lactamase superfamily II metal-dependent hydrolase